MPPRYSSFVMTVATIRGSSMTSMSWVSGSLTGFEISRTSPRVVVTRYGTDGAVVMSERSNSRSSRSWMISRWRRPR